MTDHLARVVAEKKLQSRWNKEVAAEKRRDRSNKAHRCTTQN
jgi:hypothetical protein